MKYLSNIPDINSLEERESILSKELLSGSNLDKLNDLENSRNLLNKKELEFNLAINSLSEYSKQIKLRSKSNLSDYDRNLYYLMENQDQSLEHLKEIQNEFSKNNENNGVR